MTAREMADRVLDARRNAWGKADYATAIVSTEQLGPEDMRAVHRIVAEAGYTGEKLDRMVTKVSALVVGQVEALADDMPADGAD